MGIKYHHEGISFSPAPSPLGLTGTWIAPEVFMLPIAPRECVLRNKQTGSIARATPESFGLLQYCQRFRTLADHADAVCASVPTLSGHKTWVLEQLGAFCRAGVMVNAETVVKSWHTEATRGVSDTDFHGVAIRTCERPHLLERLLESIRRTQRRHGTTFCYEVLDDSKNPSMRQRNREQCERVRAELRVRYRDLQQESPLLVELRAQFTDASREINWLLGGTETDDANTYGRPLNWALLLSAGQRFLSIDDDVILDVRRSPLERGGFAISAERDRWYFYRSEDEIVRECAPLSLDPLAAHLRHLGRSLADLLRTEAAGLTNEELCQRLTVSDLTRLDSRSSALFTQNAVLGDSGSSLHPHALYSVDDEAFARFTQSEGAYRLHTLHRYNWRGQSSMRIATTRTLTFSTIAGIDNRALLPPTARTFRNEDLLLGEVAQFMHRHAVILDLPWSLLHFRDPVKEWMPLATPTPFVQDVLHVLLEIVSEAAQDCRAEDPEARLQYLARVMLDWGAASDARLRQMLEEHVMDNRTRIAFELREDMERRPLAPAYWRQDIQRYLGGPNMGLSTKDLHAAVADAKVVRKTLQVYGHALEVWPALWKYCAAHRASE